MLLLYSWVWSLPWSVVRMRIGRGVHEGSPLTVDLFAVGKGAPSTLTTFPFHCFLLLCLQPWLIFKRPWTNLVLWSIEHDPKFGRSATIVKLLKTHFEGSATYKKLALANEKRCSIGVIYCSCVSPLSPSTGNIVFFLLFGEEEKLLFDLVLYSWEHLVFEKFLPYLCSLVLTSLSCLLLGLFEPFGDRACLCWILCM